MDNDRVYSDNLIDTAPQANVDVDSEKAVLCLCLKHDNALEKCGKSLVKEDFSDSRNACIYEHILSLYMESRKVDRYTVADYLESQGKDYAAGGRPYLYEIAEMVAVISNIDDYIASVVEKSRLRKISATLAKFSQIASQGKDSANSIINSSITELSGLIDNDDGVGFEKLDKILKDNLSQIKDIANGKGKKNVYTGFKYLDKMMGGMAPGSLNIIAARPGMGKTAFAINIAINVAILEGGNVNIFSLEMGKAEIGNRILAGRTSSSSKDLQTANLSQEKQDEVIRAIRELKNLKIWVEDKSDVTPITMRSKLQELKSSGKLGLVIVDYIQLMGSGIKRSGASRQQEITDISRELKLMAKDLDVPIIALSQLSRGAEKRDDHTPMLSDLRDSGAIEQDADTVIFIDRPDYYNKGDEKPEIADAHIILAKNRKGETGKVNMKWWGKKTTFFEEDREGDPQDPQSTGAAPKSSSPYTRTTDKASASSEYTFEEDDYATGTYDAPPESDPGDMGEDGMANPENDDFFNDSNNDFPSGMLE